MTAMLEHATLTRMDDQTRRELSDAADAYEQAPQRLRVRILTAARSGDKPAEIARAIRYVQTYDYVARIIREDRKANPELYPAAES